MSRVFVIPDIHLKPWILDRAEECLARGKYDRIVCLGDLVDDWGQERNLALYEETFDRLVDLIHRHPDFLFCYGNHDISYVWGAPESGYSEFARQTVLEGLEKLKAVLPAENIAFVHRVDRVLFSHAGLVSLFVGLFNPRYNGDLDVLLERINSYGKDQMWNDISPIWVRPQYVTRRLYPEGYLQVVGHTPVEATDFSDGLLTVDNFSSYRDGTPAGDQRFVWVDTESQEWGFAE